MTRRERIEKALIDNAVGVWEGDIHSWRCSYPDKFCDCDCFASLVDDIENAIDRETP